MILEKWFSLWSRKHTIREEVFCKAAREIIKGVVEVDSGGGLLRKRLGREGQGKRGGYRVLEGYKSPNRELVIFFMPAQKANEITFQDPGSLKRRSPRHRSKLGSSR